MEDAGIDVRMIIKWTFQEVEWAVMDWTDLFQAKDTWRAVLNAVMNLRFP